MILHSLVFCDDAWSFTHSLWAVGENNSTLKPKEPLSEVIRKNKCDTGLCETKRTTWSSVVYNTGQVPWRLAAFLTRLGLPMPPNIGKEIFMDTHTYTQTYTRLQAQTHTGHTHTHACTLALKQTHTQIIWRALWLFQMCAFQYSDRCETSDWFSCLFHLGFHLHLISSTQSNPHPLLHWAAQIYW